MIGPALQAAGVAWDLLEHGVFADDRDGEPGGHHQVSRAADNVFEGCDGGGERSQMTLAAIAEDLVDALGRLPLHSGDGAGNAPPGHPFFGAVFLFIGSLLVVETLAGGVWRRSHLRTMLWPGALLAAGLDMVDRDLRAADIRPFTCRWPSSCDWRFHRAQQREGIPRSTADMMAIPALVLGGLLIGPMHLEVNGGAIDEADATDLSRMAWLCLHADDRQRLGIFTKLGLQHDRENEYCKRLEDKLSP